MGEKDDNERIIWCFVQYVASVPVTYILARGTYTGGTTLYFLVMVCEQVLMRGVLSTVIHEVYYQGGVVKWSKHSRIE